LINQDLYRNIKTNFHGLQLQNYVEDLEFQADSMSELSMEL